MSTVAILTLGCSKNLVDSEQIASILADAGVRVSTDPSRAQVVIINTCGFIEPAKEESIDAILAVADIDKKDGPRTLIVTGCFSQRYMQELRQDLPEVDAFFGIDPVGTAYAALEALGEKRDGPHGGVQRSLRFTPAAWSYLRIAEGCDNRCAYCAIPSIRGPLSSRPVSELMEEASFLADRGIRELNVIAQDTTSYGLDLYGEPRLAQLLEELCKIESLQWIRLLYCHPRRLSDTVMSLIAGEDRICPYVDVPLQHINDEILGKMGRKVTRRQVEELLQKLREVIPGVTVRTTFLVGFPGETDDAFEELVDFVRCAQFERMGCFEYSREEGTPAAEYPGQVPQAVREKRYHRLMTVQRDIAVQQAAARVGERMPVLVEEERASDGTMCAARSQREAPDVDPVIYVESDYRLPPGTMLPVQIVESRGYDWIARIE